MTKINRVLIYGCGLVGGSLALTLKKHHPDLYIEGVSRSQASIDFAVKNGIIAHGATDLSGCSTQVDLAIIATPIDQTPSDIAKVSAHINTPCILTDVASVKSYIEEQAPPLKQTHTLILGHPMAGSDKTGVQNASDSIMAGAKYILIPQENESYNLLKDFLASAQFRLLEMNAKDHDLYAAYASHLPYIMASLTTHALATLSDAEQAKIQPILAKGFADTTRVAGSDPNWGVDICKHNKESLLTTLNHVETKLKTLKKQIELGDLNAVREVLETSAQFKRKG